MYNRNPPRPKYSATWDPETVLSYLGSEISLETSARQLAKRLAMLLALTSLFRTAELAAIEFASARMEQGQARLVLGAPRKSQRSSPLQEIVVKRIANSQVCPVAALEAYIDRTKPWRRGKRSDRLFLQCKKPHNPVTPSTIGHWLKEILAEAGVDTTVYTAHSTRSAASSSALKKGVPIQAIMQAANWASHSTFYRFYHRSCDLTDAQATEGSMGETAA